MNAQEIIHAAMRKLRVKKAGFSPSAAEMTDGLEVLNTLVKSLPAENLLVPFRTLESLTLTSGTNPHTIGSGGTLSTTMPLDIESAVIRDGDGDWPLTKKTAREYERLHIKTTSGRPDWFYYERGQNSTTPLGRIYFDYVPDANYTFRLTSYKPLSTFATLTTDVTLPDLMERFLIYNLAIDLAPEYGKEPSPAVASMAVQTRRALKDFVTAERVPVLNFPSALRRRPSYHIDEIE